MARRLVREKTWRSFSRFLIRIVRATDGLSLTRLFLSDQPQAESAVVLAELAFYVITLTVLSQADVR